jgi:hypothetical protein
MPCRHVTNTSCSTSRRRASRDGTRDSADRERTLLFRVQQCPINLVSMSPLRVPMQPCSIDVGQCRPEADNTAFLLRMSSVSLQIKSKMNGLQERADLEVKRTRARNEPACHGKHVQIVNTHHFDLAPDVDLI